MTEKKHLLDPAFPTAMGAGRYTDGMTLRQYAAIKLRVPDSGTEWLDDMIRQAQRDRFAGQALAGFMAVPAHKRPSRAETYAGAAYELADAMLEARDK